MRLQQGEQLIKQQDNAVWVKGTFNSVVGTLVLTNLRLAFEKRSVIQSAVLSPFGVAGSIADEALPRNVVVNLPLGQIAAFSQPKVVSSRKVIPIITKDGEEFLFSGPKFEQWAPALMQVGLRDATQAPSTPYALPYGQQATYSTGYAPPQTQSSSKKGIPWWGWVLIAGGIVLLACGVLTIALYILGSVVSS